MFQPLEVAADSFGDHLAEQYLKFFASRRSEYACYIGGAARMVVERLANCDALYHDVDHTIMVTLVGQQILRGRLLIHSVTPDDWLHFTCALLTHDIGYARGICPGDTATSVVIDADGNTITPRRGASDASLAPYHVERAKIYVRNRFANSEYVDPERIANAIEMTRFPVPDSADHQDTESEAGLLRAADLIGQLGDPFYHRKVNALFQEFVETGMTDELGYKDPFDLVEKYPRFFWTNVQPYIGPALRYLELTSEGKQWVANLYNNVFQVEHRKSLLGPFPGE